MRAGQRAILIIGRGQHSVCAPSAALATGASNSARTLHIGPPLPEPSELQEMIGNAAGIAGCRELAPLAMAARLLFAEPRQAVVLAIDDAHTLSHRSLAYLAQMTELLAPDAPVLQIVLAAGPLLLDALAQAEFESFRDRLLRPPFETLQTMPEPSPAPYLTHDRKDEPLAVSAKLRRISRNAVCATAGLVAVVCLGAIGAIPFPVFSMKPDAPPEPLLQRSPQSY